MILLIFILTASNVPFIPSARAASLSAWLNCDGYSSTYTQWTKAGSSPYLGAQDQPTNMISASTNGYQDGWYTFPDTSLTGTITVNMSIYCSGTSGRKDERADVYVDYTGSGSGSLVGSVAQHTNWQYDTISLGTHTAAEVNALRVYFIFVSAQSKPKTVYIDHARIGVAPSINHVSAGGPYNVGETISVTWTNNDGFGSGENYINVEYIDQNLGQQIALHSLATTATSDTYGPIGSAQAGHTIEVYVYTASGVTDDHNSAITKGDPWPQTCTVNSGAAEFPRGVSLLLLLVPVAYLIVRRRSASHTMPRTDRRVMR